MFALTSILSIWQIRIQILMSEYVYLYLTVVYLSAQCLFATSRYFCILKILIWLATLRNLVMLNTKILIVFLHSPLLVNTFGLIVSYRYFCNLQIFLHLFCILHLLLYLTDTIVSIRYLCTATGCYIGACY